MESMEKCIGGAVVVRINRIFRLIDWNIALPNTCSSKGFKYFDNIELIYVGNGIFFFEIH